MKLAVTFRAKHYKKIHIEVTLLADYSSKRSSSSTNKSVFFSDPDAAQVEPEDQPGGDLERVQGPQEERRLHRRRRDEKSHRVWIL